MLKNFLLKSDNLTHIPFPLALETSPEPEKLYRKLRECLNLEEDSCASNSPKFKTSSSVKYIGNTLST